LASYQLSNQSNELMAVESMSEMKILLLINYSTD